MFPFLSFFFPRYYPDAEDVYKGAATVTADEDAQGLEEPIIAPVKTKTFSKLDKKVRLTTVFVVLQAVVFFF